MENPDKADGQNESSNVQDFVRPVRRLSKRKQNLSSPKEECRATRRKSKSTSEQICPVCHLTIRDGDLRRHLQLEWKKLYKSLHCPLMRKKLVGLGSHIIVPPSSEDLPPLDNPSEVSNKLAEPLKNVECKGNGCEVDKNGVSSSTNGHCTGNNGNSESISVPSTSLASTSNSDDLDIPETNKKWVSTQYSEQLKEEQESFKRVKVNRALRIHSHKWDTKDIDDDIICPICQEPTFVETAEDFQLHADKCLRKTLGEESSSDEEVDVEGDEYEWCGVRKIRLTSILKSQGQLDSLGTLVQKGNEDANVEICLLDTEIGYGPSQYSQDDLDQQSVTDEPNTDTARREDDIQCPVEASTSSEECLSDNGLTREKVNGNSRHVSGNQSNLVEALQVKVRELENREGFICRICHGPYIVPLTSIACWHVHCEKCWLLALSTQKLCPQCKVIVLPKDLRRIYL